MGRIQPLDYDDLPESLKAGLVHTQKNLGFVPNSTLILARKPKIAEAFMALNKAIQDSITFPVELRRMMFHIMSHASGCMYCQAHSIGTLTGVISKDKLDTLWEFETSPAFSDAERSALRLAQASAVVPNAVTDAHFDELRKYFSEEQIVEMVAALCVGAWLNRFNDTMATTLEAHPIAVAGETIGPKGWSVGKHVARDDLAGQAMDKRPG
jgi:uncharacterized peroxidase-related enzyme